MEKIILHCRLILFLSLILLCDKSQACNNGGDNKSYINCDTVINKWKEKEFILMRELAR